MQFIWTKGPADTQATGFHVEATDSENKFRVSLPDGFHIPDNATLKHFAASYAEWSSDRETDRVVTIKQFNCGVQTGEEFRFRLPLEDDRKIQEIKSGNPVPATDLVKDVASQGEIV